MAHHIAAFLENKPGRLEELTGILGDAGVNIRAMTLSTHSAGWGVVNVLANDPQQGYAALVGAGYSVALREIVVAEVSDHPGGLHQMLTLLAEAGINVQNAYATIRPTGRSAILVIDVEDVEGASKLLEAAKIKTLTDDQIYDL